MTGRAPAAALWRWLSLAIVAGAGLWAAGPASAAISIDGGPSDGQRVTSGPSYSVAWDSGLPGTWSVSGPGFSGGGTLTTNPEPITVPTGADGLYTVDATVALETATSRTFVLDTTGPPAPTVNCAGAPFFSWNSTEAASTFAYSLNGGAEVNTGTATSVTVAPGDGTHTFSVRAFDEVLLNPSGSSNTCTFSIDTTPPGAPSGVGTAPNPTANPTPTFSWTPAEAGGSFTFQILAGGVLVPGQSGNTAAASVAAPLALASGTYTFRVWQTDAALNSGPFTDLGFTVDVTPPAGGAIGHIPVAPALQGFTKVTGVSINLTVGSSDNLPVTPFTPITYALTAAQGILGPPGFPPAPAAFSTVFPRNVTLPAAQGTHTVYLWARDALGNVSPAPVASTLVTYDTVSPSVLAAPASFPAPGANLETNFGPLANLTIAFSEPVQNPVSLISLCQGSCGTGLPVTPSYNPTTGIAILDPNAPLAIGTPHELRLGGVIDRAGNLLVGPGRTAPWTFTTSTDGTPPGPVTNLVLTPGIGQMALKWTRPTDPDLARITVLRNTTPPTGAGDANAARFSLPASATSHLDLALVPGGTYHYAVYAEDGVGNVGELARGSVATKPVPRLCIAPPKTRWAERLLPKKGKVIGTVRPVLRWRRVKGSIIYNVKVLDERRRKVVTAFPTRTSYKVPRGRLKPGHRYTWYVWGYLRHKRRYVHYPMKSWFDVRTRPKC